MDTEKQKMMAAEKSLEWIEDGMIMGVGTGRTVHCFIETLKKVRHKIAGAVASSKQTAEKLKAIHIPLLDPNLVSDLPLYIDSVDEINSALQMIKGGGGALTGEKILASMAKKMMVIADQTKKVDILGKFPVAVEVIPLARSYVARRMFEFKGRPVYRNGFTTDYGNTILDVHFDAILDPIRLEEQLNQIPGVVTHGLFAHRKADILILGTEKGCEVFEKEK